MRKPAKPTLIIRKIDSVKVLRKVARGKKVDFIDLQIVAGMVLPIVKAAMGANRDIVELERMYKLEDPRR
jgi:hypothetical protein